MRISTVEATPNIAVVKYWGKRDDKIILPMEGSQSFTIDSLKTRTTVMFSDRFKEDEFWLNGNKVDLTEKEVAERMQQLDVIRKKAGLALKAKIVSINCFPTAAGFASSASGLAALACAASKAAGLDLDSKELSILARLGSGSACRSVVGGFVEWHKGTRADGSDSYAETIYPASHWPELRLVSAVLAEGKKKVSSRAGMKQTIATSVLYPARLAYLPKLLKEMREAVGKKDFAKFAELTMRESNNMHATMLDTWPPIIYLNDLSKQVIYAVHELNANGMKAAYTFDAGPNAHVYTLENHVPEVKKMLDGIEGVQKIIVSKVGEGPKYLENPKEHLIDPVTGSVREHYYDESKNKIIVKA
ncbi:MAG: diphosphomevalonate decarboxylase [Candidatus Micrarchaeia archaeon]|jgi:diphosphomevalonate decarboxylase